MLTYRGNFRWYVRMVSRDDSYYIATESYPCSKFSAVRNSVWHLPLNCKTFSAALMFTCWFILNIIGWYEGWVFKMNSNTFMISVVDINFFVFTPNSHHPQTSICKDLNIPHNEVCYFEMQFWLCFLIFLPQVPPYISTARPAFWLHGGLSQ